LGGTPGIGKAVSAKAGPSGQRVFRLPLLARLLSLFSVALLGGVSVGMFGFVALILAADQWPVAIVIALCTAVILVLTRYSARDLQGKWGLRVVLGRDAAEFFLPKNRSLIHAMPKQHVIVPYSDIAAIETRLEAYPSFGMLNMQKPYVLHRHDNSDIFLFEERAIGSNLQSSFFGGLVDEIAKRAGVQVRDLGMIEGRGGVLGVLHTHAADWAAPALPVARQKRLLRRAAHTAALAFLLLNLIYILRVFFG